MIEIYDMLGLLPAKRRFDIFSQPACLMSEARHIENLAYHALGEVKLNVHSAWIKKVDSFFPEARAKVLTKPAQILGWEGEKTSIVLQSKKRPELEGMLVNKDGLPLRPMCSSATWPSRNKFPPSNEKEGLAVSEAVGKLGMKRFEIDEGMFYLLPLLFAKLNIEVGSHFYSNIHVFTDYWVGHWRSPWELSSARRV